MLQPQQKTINFPFFGKKDPSQYLGLWLENFAISFYPYSNISTSEIVDESKQDVTEIRKKIYEDLLENLKFLTGINESQEGVKIRYFLYEYQDERLKLRSKPDRERWVIRILYETPRQTMISTLCRFYTNGTNLYIGIDSYFIGRLKIWSLLSHTLLLLVFGLWFLIGIVTNIGTILLVIVNPLLIASLFVTILSVIIPGLYLYFSWFPVAKAMLDGESFMAALKHRFNDDQFQNLFDKDDVLTYLKSLLPLILQRLKIVLKRYGIDDPNVYKKLDEIIASIENQQITFNNSGPMFGVQFGNNNSQNNS